jgi:hypothetical protein
MRCWECHKHERQTECFQQRPGPSRLECCISFQSTSDTGREGKLAEQLLIETYLRLAPIFKETLSSDIISLPHRRWCQWCHTVLIERDGRQEGRGKLILQRASEKRREKEV